MKTKKCTKKLKGGSFFKKLIGKKFKQNGFSRLEQMEAGVPWDRLKSFIEKGEENKNSPFKEFLLNNSGNAKELELKLANEKRIEAKELELKLANEKRIEANKKRIQEIKDLRKNHSNKTPSIYIQESHSHQLSDCLKVPKNTLIIFAGPSGVETRIGFEQALNRDFSKLLKGTEDKMDFEGMKTRLQKIRAKNWYPDLTFHYSDYFGAKPTGDTPRKLKCPGEDGKTQMSTIESYTDHIYSGNKALLKFGFTTLDKFITNMNEGRTDSLDISPYHTKKLLGWDEDEDKYKGTIDAIKNNMPYFDFRDPNNNFEDFSGIQKLGEFYFNKDNANFILDRITYANTWGELYTTLEYSKKNNWNEIKLSELIAINGAGIYIHHTCRPFLESGVVKPGRANSLIALEAHCPINPKVGIDQNVTIGKYKGCELIKSITIGNKNTIINGSFEDCKKLQTVEFETGSKLEEIHPMTFVGCTSLKEIDIPESVTKLGSNTMIFKMGGEVFSFCQELKTIKFPQNGKIETIYYKTCYKCSQLKNITFPNNLKEIKEEAFYHCLSLNTITFPDKLKVIGKKAFYGCTKLNTITFPDTLKVIGEKAFYGCDKLNNITFPQNLISIGDKAFAGCTNLNEIHFKSKNITIDTEAFIGGDSLYSNTIINNVYFVENTKINGKPHDHEETKALFPEGCQIINLNLKKAMGKSKKKKKRRKRRKKKSSQRKKRKK